MQRQHFDGHHTVQPRIARAIHLTHPARAEWRKDLIGPKSRSWSQGHNWGDYTRGKVRLIGSAMTPTYYGPHDPKIRIILSCSSDVSSRVAAGACYALGLA